MRTDPSLNDHSRSSTIVILDGVIFSDLPTTSCRWIEQPKLEWLVLKNRTLRLLPNTQTIVTNESLE